MNLIDDYIITFPSETQKRLAEMRAAIKETAPEATEGFSYGMPAYKLRGKVLVYFAGYKNHIGFYATPTGHEAFKVELSGYKQGKGSVQFPHIQPLPIDLVKRIVAFKANNI